MCFVKHLFIFIFIAFEFELKYLFISFMNIIYERGHPEITHFYFRFRPANTNRAPSAAVTNGKDDHCS